AIDGQNAAAIETARTDLDMRWRDARKQLDDRRTDLRTQLDSAQKLVSLEWELPSPVAPALVAARTALAAVAAADQNGDPTRAAAAYVAPDTTVNSRETAVEGLQKAWVEALQSATAADRAAAKKVADRLAARDFRGATLFLGGATLLTTGAPGAPSAPASGPS